MRRPLAIALAAAAVLLLAAGYSLFWLSAAGTVSDGLAAWSAARRGEGFAVAYDPPVSSGFPFSLRLRLGHPSVAQPAQRWHWRAEAVEAETRPWAFRHVTVRPLGHQELGIPAGDASATVSVDAAALSATLDLDSRGGLVHATAAGDTIALTAPGLAGPAGVHRLALELTLPPSPPAPAPGPSLPPSVVLSFRLEEVTLPPANAGPLGPTLGWIAANCQLLGPLEHGSPRAALSAWRDAGGTFELKAVSLAWGALALSGDATLALDDELQPEGAASVKIRGYSQTIDALVAQGLVKRTNALLVKAALDLIAKRPADGGTPELTAPLTLERQQLSVGPFGLVRLPQVRLAE